MRDQEIIGLWEAYQQVYAQPEEVEQLDEITASMGRRAKEYRRKQEQDAHMERVNKHRERMENDPEYAKKHRESLQVHSRGANSEGGENQKESVDLFDFLLEYLVAEGYADTNQDALVLMANMSKEDLDEATRFFYKLQAKGKRSSSTAQAQLGSDADLETQKNLKMKKQRQKQMRDREDDDDPRDHGSMSAAERNPSMR